MFESCPQILKDEIIRLLEKDRFKEAKVLFDLWRLQNEVVGGI